MARPRPVTPDPGFIVLGDSIGRAMARAMGYPSRAIDGRSVYNSEGRRINPRGQNRDIFDQLSGLERGQRVVIFGGTNDCNTTAFNARAYEANLRRFLAEADRRGVLIRAWYGPVPPNAEGSSYPRIGVNAAEADAITRRVLAQHNPSIRYESFVDGSNPALRAVVDRRDDREGGDGLHFTAGESRLIAQTLAEPGTPSTVVTAPPGAPAPPPSAQGGPPRPPYSVLPRLTSLSPRDFADIQKAFIEPGDTSGNYQQRVDRMLRTEGITRTEFRDYEQYIRRTLQGAGVTPDTDVWRATSQFTQLVRGAQQQAMADGKDIGARRPDGIVGPSTAVALLNPGLSPPSNVPSRPTLSAGP
jgi:hypothetical protein